MLTCTTGRDYQVMTGVVTKQTAKFTGTCVATFTLPFEDDLGEKDFWFVLSALSVIV